MDFKGITWARNIYQKFEAMCLEVEEVMYQDTVKYAENQVQKAGVSVKKFYSEVMQDLLPPSCVDPVKVAANDLCLYPCTHPDINKKLKPSISENWGEVKNKATEDRVMTAMDERKIYPRGGLGDANYLSPLSSGVPVQNASSNLYTAKGKNVGVYKRPVLGIKRISQNDHRPKISVSVEKNRISTVSDVRGNCEMASDHMKSAIDSAERCDPGEAANTQIFDAPVDSPGSNTILSVDPVRQKEEDAQCISLCHVFPSESIGTSINGGATPELGSDINSNTYDIVSSCEEVIMSDKDNIGMEVIENEDLVEPGVNIVKQVEKSTLEETCVLVEVDELHGVAQATRKNKSYKKKIREALSSKLRSPKKKEDKCSAQYERVGGNGETVIPALTTNLDKTKLPPHEFSESDWEFL